MFRHALLSLTIVSATFVSAAAQADDYVITLKDQQFAPQKLEVPAGQKIKLIVKNEQSSAAEFESSKLDREKVVGPNSQVVVNLGPLDAGSYDYVNDFHRETTGTIVAK